MHAFHIIVCVRDQNFTSMLNGETLKCLHQPGEKGIGNIRDDQTVEAALPRSQRASVCVWIELHGCDRETHTFGGRWMDVSRSVHCS